MTKLLEMGKWEMCSITDDMEGYHSHPENQGALVWVQIDGQQQSQSAVALPKEQHSTKEVRRRELTDTTTLPNLRDEG